MKAVKSGISFIKKYGLFLCVPIFLFIAFSFVKASSPKYKATATIALKKVSAQSVIDDIKSKYLVQKVLDQLRFQVSYYDSLQPDREIYNDTLPVRLVLNHGDKIKDETTLVLKVTGDESFDLVHADTILSLRFKQPVDEYYGKFSFVHSPGEKYRHVTYIMKLYDSQSLIDQYYNAIDIEPAGDSTLTVSVKSGNPQKSAAFLNKLIQLYGSRGANLANKPDDKLKQADQRMHLLVHKATVIKDEIKKLNATNTVSKAKPDVVHVDKKQLKIYQAMKPYVEAPVRKFVQVPYISKVKDARMRVLLKQYNKLELKKRHMLAGRRYRGDVSQIENALAIQQSSLIERLYSKNKNQEIKTVSPGIVDSLRILKTSLTQIRGNIKVVKNNLAITRKAWLASKSRVSVLKKPEQNIQLVLVNRFLVYGLALAAGLLIPVLWLMIRKHTGDVPQSNNLQNLRNA